MILMLCANMSIEKDGELEAIEMRKKREVFSAKPLISCHVIST